MKKIFKYTLISALLASAFSCTDLEEEIKGDYTQNFSPANQNQIGPKAKVTKATPNDGLAGAFSRVLNGTANHGSYFSVQEISSDEAVVTQKGGDWFDGGENLVMHRHQFRSTGMIGIEGAWNDAYGGIYQCNDLLKNGNLDNPKKAQIRFLRAYFYWRLLDVFGRVKIVTEPGVDAPQQDSRLPVYNFIESELLAALPDLPSGRPEYGRASKAAANALLSRLYLNSKVYKNKNWSDAEIQADLQKSVNASNSVLNDGGYSLAYSQFDTYNYSDVFGPDNVEHPEHIFVAPYDESTAGGMNFSQMTLHYPSQLTFKLGQQPWNGYSTLEEFYNSYEAADKRKANNFIVGPQYAYNVDPNVKTPILDLAFDKADPDGAPVNYTPAINELAPNGSRQAGARLGKFSFRIGANPDMDNDFPILRLGEVILNKAEALYRLNNAAGALVEVNKIRKRAGVADFTSLSEGNLLAERGRELFQEALRRTDLIRFGAWGNAWWEKAAHSDPNKNLMPIPNAAIQTSLADTYKLTQNPGY